jgi:hypothetical protein
MAVAISTESEIDSKSDKDDKDDKDEGDSTRSEFGANYEESDEELSDD